MTLFNKKTYTLLELAIELAWQLGENDKMFRSEQRVEIINILGNINLKEVPENDIDEFILNHLKQNQTL